ncbi:MAG: hypothetical protein INR64_16500 [Caulobacteraceae bacterium]|nr:hypothetical protein [Caulobacter sp.]
MNPTNVKHAVFETSRHGDQSATVQIVGAFGTLGIVVPASGNAERMSEPQKVEALRNALAAMGEASGLLAEHLRRIDPEGEDRGKPERPIPASAVRA